MGEKKFYLQSYFLISVFLLIIISFLTYFYSYRMLEETRSTTTEDLNQKLKLLNIEDFYFDLNSSLNMDDFFFPKPNLTDGKLGNSLMHYQSVNEGLLKGLWIKSENLFNINLEKENESLIDKILENYK
ncbi:hypothetical protein BmHG_00046 [Borrelia miyamotoi]|uniref:Uncharacterized protein n=1 Tax=Borrelia miyamotoi TaxID=47466 RepID=A0AAP8YS52_9SPIR|nr:hypothetical protein [Borrelia miyamotoi]AHH05373.1 Hypothetical protein BOM_0830 [Borrelia miyamotoi FR64b]ATQ15130.1 hypothetical protein CNO14_04040 [Borrelia miyamotoi]ATQ16312.1 hypothetical protein CNO13_04040 [Borrelia miyamotoi]ATQ17456.1 hypothetical protein CNO12_04045 [Borrelia miyamotoi]ATQ18042.1 hypothetical protein CNO11_00210 [Borrelia miyamotoi]